MALSDVDRWRLDAIVQVRNCPQKPVWRARTVLPTAAGLGANASMRETGSWPRASTASSAIRRGQPMKPGWLGTIPHRYSRRGTTTL